MTDSDRRKDGGVPHDDIAELIKQEGDAKNRAFLIILQNINLSLIANTKTVNDIDEQLKQHLVTFQLRAERDDRLMNQGRGMWRILGSLLAVLQVIIGWAIVDHRAELADLRNIEAAHNNRILILEQQVVRAQKP